MTHTIKVLIVVFAVIIVASTTYVFASANTLLPGKAGEGAGSASGFTVSNVTYHLGADPSSVESVSFTMDSNATLVKIKLNDSSSIWFNCAPGTGNEWTCRTPGVTTRSVEILRVVAS
jgi:hypothetical protein